MPVRSTGCTWTPAWLLLFLLGLDLGDFGKLLLVLHELVVNLGQEKILF